MKPISLLAIGLLIFTGCNGSDNDKAGHLLTEARTAYENGRLNPAKELLDSLDNTYPRAIEIRKEGKILSYRIQLKEAEQIHAFTDSMLVIAIDKINAATADFTYLKSEYDELGRFIYKGTEAEKNVRSYLHAAVDEYGVTHLISSYRGDGPLEHTAVKVRNADGTACSTQEIPYNDGTNYHYNIGGVRFETVTYIGDKDGGVLSYIDLNKDNRLQVEFIGSRRNLSVQLTDKDKKALSETFRLGMMLRKRLQLEQDNKVATEKIIYLQRLIERKAATSDNASSESHY